MTRSRIPGSAEYLDSRFITSFSAGKHEVEEWAGIPCTVLAPYGGDRTAAEQRKINRGQKFSDHLLSSAALGRAAADIDNWHALILAGARRHKLTYDAARRAYYAIWARHGWLNQQTNGNLFPAEPWHLAKHHVDASGSGVHATPRTKDYDMPKMFHAEKPVRRILLAAGDSTLALSQNTANSLVKAYGLSTLVPPETLAAMETCARLIGKANAELAADAITAEGLALVAAPTT
jgi:hypothetical protein